MLTEYRTSIDVQTHKICRAERMITQELHDCHSVYLDNGIEVFGVSTESAERADAVCLEGLRALVRATLKSIDVLEAAQS